MTPRATTRNSGLIEEKPIMKPADNGTVTVSNIAWLPLMFVAPAAFVASTVLGWMWTR